MLNLSLIEKSFSVRDICSVDLPTLNSVGMAVKDLYPFPSGYGRFYIDFSDPETLVGIQKSWEILYEDTNYNPLILYAYCSYMHYSFFYTDYLATGFEFLPPEEHLILYYERLFFSMQQIRTV